MKPNAKKCKVCKGEFWPRNTLQKVCGWECAIKETERENERKRRIESRENKRMQKDWKIKNDGKWSKSLLQNKVNQIVRLIDSDLPCLATGQRGQIHAGHVFSRGAFPSLAFNLHNIHRQCAQSNHFQSDDIALREGVKREYGDGYYDYLESLKGFTLHLSPPERYEAYQRACKGYKLIRDDMKNFETPVNWEQRIKYRSLANDVIDLYPDYVI